MAKQRKNREFNLSKEQYQELRDRQGGRCAISGEPLNESVVPHHVVPAGHGGQQNAKTDAFVKDYQRNCVLVNDTPEFGGFRDEGAHIHAHGGNFSSGPTAPHSYFKFSHGDDHAAHQRWATQQEAFVSQEIWPSAVADAKNRQLAHSSPSAEKPASTPAAMNRRNEAVVNAAAKKESTLRSEIAPAQSASSAKQAAASQQPSREKQASAPSHTAKPPTRKQHGPKL